MPAATTAPPGRWFRLTGHFDADPAGNDNQAREFLITEVRHSADNNYQQRQCPPVTSLLNHPDYDPNHLFDAVIAMLALKNDAAVARALGIAPPVISKMRHRILPIGPALLIRLHEVTGLSIRDLRVLMGDRRPRQAWPLGAPDDAARLDARLRPHEERRQQRVAAQRSGEPYIYRIEGGKPRGGVWMVSFKHLGNRCKKRFFDSTHGGAAGALAAARTWRDQTFQPLPDVTDAQVLRRMSEATPSGVVGVYRKMSKEGGRIAEWWTAVSPNLAGQRRRSRFFSISKYGERQAFEMAVKARQAFVAELADVPHLPKHAAKQMAQRLRDAEDSGGPVSAAPQPESAPGP